MAGFYLDKHTCPLFAFIDPFGATGVPFSVVAQLLRNPRAEVLINLDADGIARLAETANIPANATHLTDLFGDQSWVPLLQETPIFQHRSRAILDLYRAKLQRLPNVRYTFPFEMRSQANTLEYFLLFASQHPRGLERMKEAMLTIDQSGRYCFSDAHVQQDHLMRFDRPADYAGQLFERFRDQWVPFKDVYDYALLETPFLNPKRMLEILEDDGRIEVHSLSSKRRRGTFPEDKIVEIGFHLKRQAPVIDNQAEPAPRQLGLWES